MTPVERLLAKLKDVKKAGNGWSARCPAHDDQRASLSISEGDDGRALTKCHAGCKFDAICAAVGQTPADLFSQSASPQSNCKRQIVATYDYRDEAGELLLQVVRHEPKSFRQRRPKAGGGWVWSAKGVRVVPYRLPQLLAEPTQRVFVTEGEKDCDNLAHIDLLAVCNAGGAGKWTMEHAAYLRGRHVVVLADNDEAGRRHAQQVAKTLDGIAASVRIVHLPDLPPKGDVTVWIEAGGNKDELERIADATPVWTSAAAPMDGPVLTCLADVEPRKVDWLWEGRIPLGRITLLVGNPGEGKSFLTTYLAARVTTGSPWPDGSVCAKGSVILISAEDDPGDTIRPRLDAHHADARKVHLLSGIRYVDGDGEHERVVTLHDLAEIEEVLRRLSDCKLLVVDPIGSYLGSRIDAHRDNEVRAVLAPLAKLAERYGIAVLVVAHCRKGTGGNADELALGSRAFTAIARAVWHVRRDLEDKNRRLLLPGKNNLAHEGDGLAFSISGEPPCISWEPEPVTMTADEALAKENGGREDRKPGPEAEAHGAASAWLRSVLVGGPRLAKELFDEWKNGQGGSERTLKRAKQSVKVEAYRVKIPGPWWWRLPDKDARPPEGDLLGSLGILAETAGKLPGFDADDSKEAKLHEPGIVGGERVRVTL